MSENKLAIDLPDVIRLAKECGAERYGGEHDSNDQVFSEERLLTFYKRAQAEGMEKAAALAEGKHLNGQAMYGNRAQLAAALRALAAELKGGK